MIKFYIYRVCVAKVCEKVPSITDVSPFCINTFNETFMVTVQACTLARGDFSPFFLTEQFQLRDFGWFPCINFLLQVLLQHFYTSRSGLWLSHSFYYYRLFYTGVPCTLICHQYSFIQLQPDQRSSQQGYLDTPVWVGKAFENWPFSQ